MNSNKVTEYIDLCRKGDSRAFGYIVEKYQQLVYVLAFRLLCDEEDAKDAVQETFIKVWKSIYGYKEQYKFSTWIYKIAANVCYDRLRKERRVVRVDIGECDPGSEAVQESLIDNSYLKRVIIDATEGLSPKQKLVFTLCELEELEVKEVSAITGLSPAKIKSNLYLAKKHIKARINYEG